MGGDCNCTITSDRQRLYQILGHLIDNAIKFTESGEIRVDYLREDDCMIIEVHDSGIGMDQNQQEVFLAPFRTGEIVDFEYHGGAGLGLAIVKQNLDLLNGKITFQLNAGEGTTVTLSFPHI